MAVQYRYNRFLLYYTRERTGLPSQIYTDVQYVYIASYYSLTHTPSI